MSDIAYKVFEDFSIDMLRLVYEMAGRKAMTEDELCPASYAEGIRIEELAEEFVNEIRNLSAQRAPPLTLAAHCLRFPIWRQPFKNCNHRTGYALCVQVLELFDYELTLPSEEIIDFVFSINRLNRTYSDVEQWLAKNTRTKTK